MNVIFLSCKDLKNYLKWTEIPIKSLLIYFFLRTILHSIVLFNTAIAVFILFSIPVFPRSFAIQRIVVVATKKILLNWYLFRNYFWTNSMLSLKIFWSHIDILRIFFLLFFSCNLIESIRFSLSLSCSNIPMSHPFLFPTIFVE